MDINEDDEQLGETSEEDDSELSDGEVTGYSIAWCLVAS